MEKPKYQGCQGREKNFEGKLQLSIGACLRLLLKKLCMQQAGGRTQGGLLPPFGMQKIALTILDARYRGASLLLTC